MNIVMHCGGMPFDGNTLKTKSLGGSETAAIYMARHLVALGHNVTLFTRCSTASSYDGVKYVPMGRITDETPLGTDFTYYATRTPSDALIIQRHPLAFHTNYASKVNVLWLHDLAQRQMSGPINAMMWNVNKIAAVSHWHRDQVAQVYGLPEDAFAVVHNGIDLESYEDVSSRSVWTGEGTLELIYSSRPERGLQYLIERGGVMDRLKEAGINARLNVCGYDNTTQQMEGLYNHLWRVCEYRDEVTNHGALTKAQLAALQMRCHIHAYPSTFQETSCITAMECAAAGLPFVGCRVGALPETMHGAGAILVDGPDQVADEIIRIARTSTAWMGLHRDQIHAAPEFSWQMSARRMETMIEAELQRSSTFGRLAQYRRNSDIAAIEDRLTRSGVPSTVRKTFNQELDEHYEFYMNNSYAQHYADYYAYEARRGVNYGPENMDGNTRFETVCSRIQENIGSGMVILDYGCAHGHYTVNLAKRMPGLQFVGVDLDRSNVAKARAWAEAEGLSNVAFYVGDASDPKYGDENWRSFAYDMVIAAEVVEHVGEPAKYLEQLHRLLTVDGMMILTVPFGPWEWQGYHEHHPWRAHLHHFERQDLHEMLGHFPDYHILSVPSGSAKNGQALGSYLVEYRPDDHPVCPIDYERKWGQSDGQAITACMIVRNGEESLMRCLRSLTEVVDQIVIGVDPTTTDSTRDVIDMYREEIGVYPPVHVFDVTPPLQDGFDNARNETLQHADGDWILWIDHDEILIHGQSLRKYLRPNHFHGYMLAQNHMASDPPGLLKTDFPVRVFRNNVGIKFFGLVHEHPETAVNAGVGPATLIHDVFITHDGYQTEQVRRGRFSRNINLLAKDREVYPDRILGKFLWMRDLAQMSRYETERNGGRVTDHSIEMAMEGIDLYMELMSKRSVRMVIDGLPFYSELVRLTGDGVKMSFSISVAPHYGTVNASSPITGDFHTVEAAEEFIRCVSSSAFDSLV